MSDIERQENSPQSEPIGLKEVFYPFDSHISLWTPPSKPISERDIDTESEEQLIEFIQQMKPENRKKWGARSSIQLDFSSTSSGQKILEQLSIRKMPPISFRITALSGNTPARRITVTPFNPEAGHIPNETDKDADVRSHLFLIDPLAAFFNTIDVSKAPLLFEAKFIPSVELSKEGLVTRKNSFTFAPQFIQLLNGLHFQLDCNTDEGLKSYTAEPPSYVSVGMLEYLHTFMPEGKPSGKDPLYNSRGFMIALPGNQQILDQKVSARFIWKPPS